MEITSLTKMTDFLLTKYHYTLGNYSSKFKPSIEDIIDDIIQYYEGIIDCMPGNVYWLDSNGVAIGCNKNVLDMFGLKSMAEFKGLSFEDMSRIGNWPPEAETSFKKDTLEVIASGKPKINIEEPSIPHVNGSMIYFLTSRVPLRDHKGNVIGVVGISIDITELKNTQQALMKAKKQAESANQIKTEFIRNMQHDVRTPFSGIYSMAKILESKESDLEKKECLSSIADSAKQLLDYCNNILDFSKLESGNLPLLAKKFNLRQLVNDIIIMEKPPAKIKGLDLIIDYSEHIPSLFISDFYRIKGILINLVSNAIKFTEKGFVKIKLDVAKKIDDTHLILKIYIEDTGIGIPKDKQTIIYEKFNRLSPSDQSFYKGSGLGLTLVKQFIEELEGEIDIHSAPNEGTTFACTIPMQLPLLGDTDTADADKLK